MKRRAFVLATVLAGVAIASPVEATQCRQVNVLYENMTIPTGTQCKHDYQHGNAFASAYSKVRRIPPPPGTSVYCSEAGTRVWAGAGFTPGPLVKSTNTWKQSSVLYQNIVFSRLYAYDNSSVDYWNDDMNPFC